MKQIDGNSKHIYMFLYIYIYICVYFINVLQYVYLSHILEIKHLIGKSVNLPIVNREIPIFSEEYVDKDFGTGCV